MNLVWVPWSILPLSTPALKVWEHIARRVKWADPGLDMQVKTTAILQL